MYLNRNVEALVKHYLRNFPCVALTGPRQPGKSTLVRHVLSDYPYASFDDPQEEMAFNDDPRGFLSRFEGPVVLDEVQRVPDLFPYLKLSIDATPQECGRYVLTGSNQLIFQKNMSESLAGRIGLLSLLPLERSEMLPETRAAQLLWGSYPGLVTRQFGAVREWYASYLLTYLERDLRLVFDIGKLGDFQILLRLLAARTSQEQNAALLAREIGVSSPTVEKWISVLNSSFITFTLRSFHRNVGKRLIKRPKLYFWDTGLVSYLAGLRDYETLAGSLLAGPLFENLVIAELLKRNLHGGLDRELWFYRDNEGQEIDLIVEDRGKGEVSFIEIKSGQTAKIGWAENLQKAVRVLRPGFESQSYKTKVQVVYQGESKLSWPRPGIDFLNFEEFLG